MSSPRYVFSDVQLSHCCTVFFSASMLTTERNSSKLAAETCCYINVIFAKYEQLTYSNKVIYHSQQKTTTTENARTSSQTAHAQCALCWRNNGALQLRALTWQPAHLLELFDLIHFYYVIFRWTFSFMELNVVLLRPVKTAM